MAEQAIDDYVLGTHDEELNRLGLQHSVWRPTALACWQRAGITRGSQILDIGCGPGFATIDLAEIVGDKGRVTAVERSARFVEATERACATKGFKNVDVHNLDLMTEPLPVQGFDAAWIRWVACFVSNPAKLVSSIASALRPGGVAVFHEYIDYSTWKLAPPSPFVEEFVQHVMQSWRQTGGEPDIARSLPSMLSESGFAIRETRPHVFCTRPSDYIWQWPAAFLDINLNRLLELGLVDDDWVSSVRQAMVRAEANPESLMVTPMVLEIVAEKRE